MFTQEKFSSLLDRENVTTAEALDLFDSLDAVSLDFMYGRWKGAGFHTGHPMDGLLEVANWYGKEFVSPDCVHPLLFSDGNHNVFKVSPDPLLIKLALRLPIPTGNTFKPFFTLFNPLLKTEDSQARLRMMKHRGKLSATMIYDHLPIHDHFRRGDDNTVMGLMDYKASPQPFFFLLHRA